MWVQFIPQPYVNVIKISTYETPTSDKHGVDLSLPDFNVSKMRRLIVLRNNRIALQMILIFIYLLFYFNLPITEIDICFKTGSVSWKSQALLHSIHEIFK